MLRAVFLITGVIFVLTGLYLYFLPPAVAALLGVAPLWLARVAGGVVLAWGASTLAGSARPDGLRTGALVGGNLLVVASLLAPVIAAGSTLPPTARPLLLGVVIVLGVLAAAAVLAYPSRQRRGL
ncbi:hypothetical protein E7T09_06455 [Deinococcus sp. KSM4-11]|uniref:hypothetical protein n=1 Tax=Deinococcus sp. KSM4-11 TaxID=2568654 RepID=UPI0010A4757C|nr:hypothetical protein [Deinococcus sp. KSM4-11]THF88810.1 hypothetical protein E7T09_06455 [Deinococcus sp. KSM4-11]